MSSSAMVNLYEDSSGDELLNGGPIFASSPGRAVASRSSNDSVLRDAHISNNNKRPPAPAAKPKKKKKKSEMPHCLIWVCTHGKGQSRTWRQKDLHLVGVYVNKETAQQAKEQVMSQHECAGYGDILVGGCWDDEIDLVIREAPMFGFDNADDE